MSVDHEIINILKGMSEDDFYYYCLNNTLKASDFDDFIADEMMKIENDAFEILPIEYRTIERAKKYIRNTIIFNKDNLSFVSHLMGQELKTFMLEEMHHGFRFIDKASVTDSEYRKCLSKCLTSPKVKWFEILRYIPVHLVTKEQAVSMVKINVDNAEYLHEDYWDLSVIDFLLEHQPRLVLFAPKEYLTLALLKKVTTRSPILLGSIKDCHICDELILHTMEARKEFYSLYVTTIYRFKSVSLLTKLSILGCYSARFLDDLVEYQVEFNPVEMLSRALYKASNTKVVFGCVNRIKKLFSAKELLVAYKSFESQMDRNTQTKIIEWLSLDIQSANEDYLCPCCDKPLPMALVEAIRSSATN